MKRFSDRRVCRTPASELAKLAIGRILFSDKSEAVGLVLKDGSEGNDENLRSESLYAVSEIKRNKDGSTDIKFYDKLKAAELMFEIGKAEIENEESGSEFLEGFLKSAHQISLSRSEDDRYKSVGEIPSDREDDSES